MDLPRLLLSCVLFFVFCNYTWPEQTQQPLTYSVEIELSQIAIRIIDKSGKPVSGITKEDLELLEDGAPQEIRFIDEISVDSRAQALAPQTSASQETNPKQPSVPPNFIFIIFDTSNSGQPGIEKHKKYLKQFLGNLESPNTMFCIVLIKPSGDYEVAQKFSTQKSDLLKVIDEIHGSSAGIEERKFKASRLSDSRRLENCASSSGFNKMECAEQALREIADKANTLASEDQVRSSNSIRSLKEIFASAEHIPGQKSVILVSEGMDPAGSFYYNYAADVIEHFIQHFGLPPSMRSVISEVQLDANRSISKLQEIQQLIQSANAGKLPVYWINPEYGKKVEDISSELSAISSLTTKLVNAPDVQYTMRGVAEDTGGAALSSTDMNSFYDYLADIIPTYYIISYKPSRAINDGRIHNIVVNSKNKNFVVMYAKNFKDFILKDRISNQLAAAHDFPDLTRDFSFTNEVNYFKNEDGKYHVNIDTGIPYEEIEPQISGENVFDDLHLSFIVRNTKGDVIFNAHPIVQIRQKQSEFQNLKERRATLDFHQPFNVASGNYTISVAIMDVAKWKTSAEATALRLPGETDSCLSIAPAMLASKVSRSESTSKFPAATLNGEILYANNVLSFSTNRIFAPSGSLQGFYQVYNARTNDNEALSVFISFKLYRDKSVFINETPEHKITSFTDPLRKMISNYFAIPYKNLSPGTYELEISVRDTNSACSTSTSVEFQIATNG